MSVVLNGHTYSISDFTGTDGRGYSDIFAATGTQVFPESIFTDLIAELAASAPLSLGYGAAGGIIVSTGSAWARAASATITSAGAATFGTLGCGAISSTGDLTTIFHAANSGNPEFKFGASAAECLRIQPVYDGGAQTLNYVVFDTVAASGSANKGEIRFQVDEDASGTSAVRIQDAGVDIAGTLTVGGSGPHVIGGATIGRVRLLLDGAFTSDGSSDGSEGLRVQGAITGAAEDLDHLSGSWFVNSIVTQEATENIAVVSQVRIDEPGITDRLTGDITVAASLYITGAPHEGEDNAALWVAGGSIVTAGHIICGPNSVTDAGYNNATYPLTVAYTGSAHQGAGWYDKSTGATGRYAIYFRRYPSNRIWARASVELRE